MFLILQRFFSPALFTVKLWTFHRDFFTYYKISVNFTQNLQEK